MSMIVHTDRGTRSHNHGPRGFSSGGSPVPRIPAAAAAKPPLRSQIPTQDPNARSQRKIPTQDPNASRSLRDTPSRNCGQCTSSRKPPASSLSAQPHETPGMSVLHSRWSAPARCCASFRAGRCCRTGRPSQGRQGLPPSSDATAPQAWSASFDLPSPASKSSRWDDARNLDR